MPKFILIDHSLSTIGGHHFEYALHVLKAADRAGFDIWLAANQRFHHENTLPERWRVRSLYQYSTYTQHRFSLNDGAPGGRWNIKRLLPQWIRQRWTARRREQRAAAFARDTAQLFGEIDLEPGDQVFIPTLSELDLMGLGRYLAFEERTERVDWHLQFHFPIFTGCEPDYAAQRPRVEKLQAFMGAAIAPAAGRRLHFYATTAQLVAQFNRLQVATFQTLPYPVNPALQLGRPQSVRPQRSEARPLRITYLGDAREEKNYHYLPALVGDLWRRYIETDRVRFVLQSHLGFSKSARDKHPQIVDSVAALRRFPQHKIELLHNALETHEFCQLVQSTDIGLLIYDRRPYFSRCSGVLVELLTAGRPVLTSAGCWMADQLAEATRDYHFSLRHNGRVLRASPIAADAPIAVPRGSSDLLLFFRWPKQLGESAGMYVRAETSFESADGTPGDRWTSVVGPAKADCWSTALVRVPAGASAARIDWQDAYGAAPVELDEIEGCFLAADAHCDTARPRGAVGLVAATPSQAAVLLEDLIENIDHYRNTAAQFARTWSSWHNPDRVVAELLSQRQALPLPTERRLEPVALVRGHAG